VAGKRPWCEFFPPGLKALGIISIFPVRTSTVRLFNFSWMEFEHAGISHRHVDFFRNPTLSAAPLRVGAF
jgi:hypothetical protein